MRNRKLNSKKSVSSPSTSTSKSTLCADCGQSFDTVTSYNYHRRIVHKSNPFEVRSLPDQCELLPAKDGQPPKARCGLCSAVLLPKNMKEHLRRHSIQLECQDCGKTFKCQRDLKAHRELHQSVQVVCPECGIGFKSKAVFRSHRAKKHSEKSKSTAKRQCPECRKMFHPSSFSKHKARFHSKTKNTSFCDFCKQMFNKESMKKHYCHANKLSCDICHLTFKTNAFLQIHKESHLETNETNFEFTLPSSPQHKFSEASMPSPLLVYPNPEND